MGHDPHPTPIVTTRTVVELVGAAGDYLKCTRVGLLSLYPARISM
jgi:hypothetical protein